MHQHQAIDNESLGASAKTLWDRDWTKAMGVRSGMTVRRDVNKVCELVLSWITHPRGLAITRRGPNEPSVTQARHLDTDIARMEKRVASRRN
jgi:hypothetical protein